MNPAAPELEHYRLHDHCCRVCFGRVISRKGPQEGTRVYYCTNCGLERIGRTVEALCACGVHLKTGRLAGLRCIKNPSPTPESPSRFIVEETTK